MNPFKALISTIKTLMTGLHTFLQTSREDLHVGRGGDLWGGGGGRGGSVKPPGIRIP